MTNNLSLTVRRALEEDFPGVYELELENFKGNLSEQDKADGFLSIAFSIDQLKEMAEDGILIVANSAGETAGFLSTQTCKYNEPIPLPARMLETLKTAHLDGAPIDLQATLVCGPVCVGKKFRGLGILESMYKVLGKESKGKFTTGACFVSEANGRSLKAHIEKLGMRRVGTFEFEGRSFAVLAAPLEQYQ